ncbi:MAG TPA: ABC transporter permease [Candidatus Acidoferrum sp.]|nr:ABC transporter permease [Candidatus Acidoferrum sp.]
MKSRWFKWSLGALSVVLFAFLYAPLAVVVVNSFNAAPRGGDWRGATLHWYEALSQNSVALDATRNTILLALGSTAIATVIGTSLALGLAGTRFRGKRTIETAILLPIVIPDIVMAIALLLLFHEARERLNVLQPGLLTMTLAHVTFQIPFVAMIVRARLAGFDRTLEEAAHDLGADRWQTFWRVKFPLICPGILAGALLAFTLSIDDFVVSFFTTGPGATTLPIYIYSSVKRGITPEINALSTLFIVVAIVATASLALLQSRARK